MAPQRPGQRHEVGVAALDAHQRDRAGVHVVLDLLETPVVPDHERDRQTQLGGRDQLLDGEHHAAVAGQDEDREVGSGHLGADGVREAAAQRAVARRVVPAPRFLQRQGEGPRVDELTGVAVVDGLGGQPGGECLQQSCVLLLGGGQVAGNLVPDRGDLAGQGLCVGGRTLVTQGGEQGLDGGSGVRHHPHVGRVLVRHLGGVDVDADQRATQVHLVDEAVGLGQLGADGHDHVRRGEERPHLGPDRGGIEVALVAARHDSLAGVAGNGHGAQAVDEPPHCAGGPDGTSTDHDDGS